MSYAKEVWATVALGLIVVAIIYFLGYTTPAKIHLNNSDTGLYYLVKTSMPYTNHQFCYSLPTLPSETCVNGSIVYGKGAPYQQACWPKNITNDTVLNVSQTVLMFYNKTDVWGPPYFVWMNESGTPVMHTLKPEYSMGGLNCSV